MDKFVTVGHDFWVLAKMNKAILIFSVASTEICVLTYGNSIDNCWFVLVVADLHLSNGNIMGKYVISGFQSGVIFLSICVVYWFCKEANA